MIDDALAHFGKRGMKWGVRTKSSTPQPPKSKIRKFHDRVETTAFVASVVISVGGAVALGIMNRQGQTPVNSINNRHTKKAVKAIPNFVWKESVSNISKSIGDANKDQDRWMRKQGLGAIINNR